MRTESGCLDWPQNPLSLYPQKWGKVAREGATFRENLKNVYKVKNLHLQDISVHIGIFSLLFLVTKKSPNVYKISLFCKLFN